MDILKKLMEKTLVPANESKEKIKNYKELQIKIRDLIKLIIKNLNDYYEYYEKYMKIKFDSDENLPLNKTIEILILKVVIKAVFHENNKYYPHDFFR